MTAQNLKGLATCCVERVFLDLHAKSKKAETRTSHVVEDGNRGEGCPQKDITRDISPGTGGVEVEHLGPRSSAPRASSKTAGLQHISMRDAVPIMRSHLLYTLQQSISSRC